jgi:DNA-binding GntR family transcriptional regulator
MDELPAFATRAEAVAQHIRSAILRGDYPPQTRLRQAEIAQELGVSTTPVREAFKLLIPAGYLHGDPHRGVFVTHPDADAMRQIYEVRVELEGLAAAKAAERVSDQDLTDLERLNEQMKQVDASAPDADETHYALNTAFHSRIYQAAGNPRLHELIMGLRTQSDVYGRMLTLQGAGGVEATDAQHDAILDALRRHSPREARKAMRVHLEFNAEHIAQQLAARSDAATADASTRSAPA